MMNKPYKRIYHFEKNKVELMKSMVKLLGAKGANLAEMTSIGIPVPPGFTITTECCSEYHNDHCKQLPTGLIDEVHLNIGILEKESRKVFGSDNKPLLVSVRSSAAVNLPGIAGTILNLGLNDQVLEGLAHASGNRCFALDTYQRLISRFSTLVMDIGKEIFKKGFDTVKSRHGIRPEMEMKEGFFEELILVYKKIYKDHIGEDFPQDTFLQLERTIEKAFKQWNDPRVIKYRQFHRTPEFLGIAVSVQEMVFGNLGEDSGTGIIFTRNPSTGRNELSGEFLINAQGDDIKEGVHTPQPLKEFTEKRKDIYRELLKAKQTLEGHYRDMQDFEFTIERGTVYVLRTRTGKRTEAAALKIATDMVKEKLIDKRTAILRISPNNLNQLLVPTFDPNVQRNVLTSGLPASPGAASGKLAFTADEVFERATKGESVILVRRQTSPEDIRVMRVAAGILTSTGGMTSHAAVVARASGKCCVVGARELQIDEKKKTLTINTRKFSQEDVLSIDGLTGEIIVGEIRLQPPTLSADLTTLLKWGDRYRTLGVRANADTPEHAAIARSFGAEGIGLCRTEHMFFERDRIQALRGMILALEEQERRIALNKLLIYQRKDFEDIFTVMRDLPVTVRLLDAPIHEFLPQDPTSQKELADTLNVPTAIIAARVMQVCETNPMLGHRGCRLLITHPEILEMQVTAITEATINCKKKGINARPEIMIPLVSTATELAMLRGKILETIEQVIDRMKYNKKLDIPIGTMIETPRAALTADQIAVYADFFSFGTNDLTQLMFGFSRDDVNTFLPNYLEKEILEKDPFESLDTVGVGQLIHLCVDKSRNVKKLLKLGVCGEHGGDPISIEFCNRIGLDYVSCSPFRIPVALAGGSTICPEKQ